jgi:uncharacterized protein YbbK (DUF523 family)
VTSLRRCSRVDTISVVMRALEAWTTGSCSSDEAADMLRGTHRHHSVPVVVFSACLVGFDVTYNAGLKQDLPLLAQKGKKKLYHRGPLTFMSDVLSSRGAGLLDVRALCPEVNILGLPVPRNPIKQVSSSDDEATDSDSSDGHVVLHDAVTGQPLQHQMVPLPQPTICDQLRPLLREFGGGEGMMPLSDDDPFARLAGFVLRSRSPSCGVWDARIYRKEAIGEVKTKAADGVFVKAWVRRLARELQRPIAVTSDTLLRSPVPVPPALKDHPQAAGPSSVVVTHRGAESFLRAVLA